MPFTKSFLNAHPVGCVYTSSVSTSPAILFGGTWAAIDGVFIVAKSSAGTFSTAGATGGVETVTLSAAQSGLPAHTHTFNTAVQLGINGSNTSHGTAYNAQMGSTFSINNVTAAAATTAHSNLPPYKVYYQWERTA